MTIAIFLFFTFSGSRRWYYILPIMPFCMILLSAYLLEDGELKWRRLATRATFVVMLIGAGLLFLVPVAVNFYSRGTPVPRDFLAGAALAATGVIALLLFRKSNFGALIPAGRDLPVLMPVLLIVAALEMVSVFDFMLPGADSYRQLKPFTLSLLAQVRHEERMAFFKRTNAAMAFYLNASAPIVVVNSSNDLPPSNTGWVIISEEADRDSLFGAFPNLRNEPPMLKESYPLKKALLETAGLVAYRLH